MTRKRFYTRIGVITAMLLALSGCSTLDAINPFSRKVEPRNVPAPLVEFTQTRTARVLWTTNIGSAGDYLFTPVVTREGVYAASADGTIVRLDASTGQVVWRINAGTKLSAGVGSDSGVVVVAGEKGSLLAFDADGKQLWKIQVPSEILSAPAIGQDTVVVRGLDNTVRAYELLTGARKWEVPRRAPALTLRAAPGITAIGPVAIISAPGGRLTSLVLQNGGIHWDVGVGDPKGATELERIADTSGFPSIFRDRVCAAAFQGRVACYQIVNGNHIWSKNFSSDVGVTQDGYLVFAADAAGSVYAFTSDRGQSYWRNEKLAHRGLTAPAIVGNVLAVGDAQGYVHFLSREEGAFVARLSIDKTAIMPTPAAAGDKLIVQTRAGTLAAITVD